MTALRSTTRGISPVIGGVLLLAIVLLLSAIVAGMLFDLTGETDPAPEISFALEETDDSPFERWIVHEQGEQLDGDAVEIRGIADADGLSGSTLLASERHRVLPTDETIRIVWSGESGTSYTLREFSVDPERTAPEPDVACDWVDSESNGGVDDVKVDDSVVYCDVRTDKVIEVQDGGVVIGDIESRTKLLDADDAAIYGTVVVEADANLQSSTISGSVTARTETVKVDDAAVGGSVTGEKTVEVIAESAVDGDVVSNQKDVKILTDSEVSGDVVSYNGAVKLEDATVAGDVYVDPAAFDCTDSTIAGQPCAEYTPKSPTEY